MAFVMRRAFYISKVYSVIDGLDIECAVGVEGGDGHALHPLAFGLAETGAHMVFVIAAGQAVYEINSLVYGAPVVDVVVPRKYAVGAALLKYRVKHSAVEGR